jgi:putative phage-type endonuclease
VTAALQTTAQAEAAAERTAWLAARKKGIGGSDAAVLFDCNPWASRFTLYQDKIGAAVDDKETPATYWGRKLESTVREAYGEILGREVSDGVTMAKHEEHGFMLANTDGTVHPIPTQDGPGVYEGKTTSVFLAANWEDDVPLYYQVQVQHYLAVLGLAWASIACLVMGQRDPFVWRDVERNDRFIEALQEKEHAFWHGNVLARVEPPVDGSKSTTKAIKLLHPHDSGRLIMLPTEAGVWWDEREQVSGEIKDLEARKDLLSNQLRHAVGPASYGAIADEDGVIISGVSCKTQNSRLSANDVLAAVKTEIGDDAREVVEAKVRRGLGTHRVLRGAAQKTLAKVHDGQERADAFNEEQTNGEG